MAELAAVREPEWLKERRSDAARRAAELDLPRFKGKAGLGVHGHHEARPRGVRRRRARRGRRERCRPRRDAARGARGRASPRPGRRPRARRRRRAGGRPDRAAADAGRRAHPELVREHLGTIVDAEQDVFTALNDAGWTGGAFVYVPRNVRVEQPIVLTAISDAAGTALHRRVLIVVEEGAEAEVWEQHLSGSTDAETMLTSIVELRVGQNAKLRFVGAQDMNESSWVFGSQRAEVARDGAPGLGDRGLRLRQRQGVHGDAAGRRGLARQGHRRLRPARAPARGLPHAAGARRGQHDVGPRVPRHPRRPLVRGLARDDQGRPGRPADRRLPGVPQPAALQEGARGRDPGPGDPRQRRALHARGGDRPDRPGAGLLPALPRARRRRSPSGS